MQTTFPQLRVIANRRKTVASQNYVRTSFRGLFWALLIGFVALVASFALYLAAAMLAIRQMRQRALAEGTARETLDRTQRQSEVVGIVGRSEMLIAGDVDAVSRQITELAAKTVGCERVNAWLFNDDETELQCIDLYEAQPNRHSAGMTLRESEYRAEFQALKSARYVNADEPLTDPRTAGYADSYLRPLGITSMLDAVINASGRNLGLLCFEHVNKPHHWEQDEIAFACQLADKIGLALISRVRRQAEGDLRASDARFRTIYNSVSDAILAHDTRTGAILDVNARAVEIFGYTREQILAGDVGMLSVGTHPYTQADAAKWITTAATAEIETFEWHFKARDGHLFWGEVSLRRAEFGAAEVVLATVHDISERKRAQQELQFANSLLTTEMETSLDAILVVDTVGKVVSFNQRFVEMWRIPLALVNARADEPVLKTVVSQVKDPDAFLARVRHLYEHPDEKGEDEIATTDGRLIDRYTAALKAPTGQYFGRVWFFRDVTESKQSARLLRDERDFTSALIDGMPGILFVLDQHGRNVRFNANLATMTGWSSEELLGMEGLRNVAAADRDRASAKIREVFERGHAEEEIGLVHRSGDERRFFLSARRIPLADGPGLLGIGVDVTEARKAELMLRESRERYQGLVETTLDWVWEMDEEFRYTYSSPRSFELLGYSPAEILGRTAFDLMKPEDAERAAAETADLFGERRPMLNYESRFVHKSGREVFTETNASAFYDAQGHFRGYRGIDRDVTDRKRVTEALKESEERFRTVAEAAQDAIIMIDAGGHVRYWNRGAERILGYTAEEAEGKQIHQFIASEGFREKADLGLREFAATGLGAVVGKTVELAATGKDGVEFPVELSLASMRLGGEWNAVAIMRDITERKHDEQRILRMARFDGLTGLANRTVFAEAAQQSIARAQRGDKGFAILYLDLDHFKDINDTLGHPVGDLLLKSVADRLRKLVRATDTVARFGGDEFAVLAAEIVDPLDAGVLAAKVLEVVSKPMTIGGNELRIGASVGIAVYGTDSLDAEILLSHADVALYRAKWEGRGTYRFFTDAMDEEVRDRVTLDTDLRHALAEQQFFLLYQPQVDSMTGRITGVEALVRWRHPQRGIIPPDKFIPAAEKNGLIVPLGHWVLHEACRQAKAWADAGAALPVMAVNLSALQFKAPLELERDIGAALSANDLPPARLELELTETVLMEASREHNDLLLRLHKSGIRIAIDDFGTGYSSLDYLRQYPVDRIKIAQVFIPDLLQRRGNAAIVKASIGLARELGINVIAEGVETAEQLRLLQEWGCREVQGYYFSKPVPADEIFALLRAGTIRRAQTAVEDAVA